MHKSQSGIQYVEYEESYAPAMVTLWDESRESFGGFSGAMTVERILDEEKNTESIKTWLALDGERLVGYCKLAPFLEEKKTLYIHLINVHPAYHGKGIGKAMIRMCIEETIRQGYPRLDLYTWSGNLKALPLYKKCGFFWAFRPDRTHLINLMPNAITHGLVGHLFEDLDRYDDQKREIHIQPDGQKLGDFEFFRYRWEKENTFLEMEYERKSRGLRRIDCSDFSITMVLDQSRLVWGKSHSVRFEVSNKTTAPIDVEIEGVDDSCVRSDFHCKARVENEAVLEGAFFLDKPSQSYPEDFPRTFPVIEAKVKIGNRQGIMKIGVQPLAPLEWEVPDQSHTFALDKPQSIFLNLENHCLEARVFCFSLPSQKEVTFPEKDWMVPMEPGEKKSLEVPVILHEGCSLAKEIEVHSESPQPLHFHKELALFFPVRFGSYGAVTEKEARIYMNGIQLQFNRKMSWTSGEFKLLGQSAYMNFCNPSVVYDGKVSEEFFRAEVDRFEIAKSSEWIELTAFFEGEMGIGMEHHYSLYPDGRVKNWIEIENRSCTASIALKFHQIPYVHNSFLPYKSKILRTNESFEDEDDNLDFDSIDENWIYSHLYGSHDIYLSMWWDREVSVRQSDWLLCFEEEIGRMEPGTRHVSMPVWKGFNLFSGWKDLRHFAQGGEMHAREVIEAIEVSLNEGNPITDAAEVEAVYSEHRNLETVKKPPFQKPVHLPLEPGLNRLSFTVDAKRPTLIRERVVFHRSGKIRCVERLEKPLEDLAMRVLEVDNGILVMKASPYFSPGLYSLTYQGKEMLDHLYPVPGAKQWKNPWCGGLMRSLSIPAVFLKERIEASFITQKDNFENEWQGIQTRVHYENSQEWEGLVHYVNYLTLEGCPIVAVFDEVHSRIHKAKTSTSTMECAFRLGSYATQYYHHHTREGQARMYSGKGYSEIEIHDAFFSVENEEVDHKIFLIDPWAVRAIMLLADEMAVTLCKSTPQQIPPYGVIRSKPSFLVISSTRMDPRWFVDYQNLHFPSESYLLSGKDP